MNNRIILNGCAPDPLIYYLKALGIFRLVAEQFDAHARGSWQGDAFTLTTTRAVDELVDFFLNRYEPTPIVAPWNGGSGFYPQDKNQRAMLESLCEIKSSRLDEYRQTIQSARSLVSERQQQPKDEEKADVLRQARRAFSDVAVKWLDAAYVLGETKPDYPPILGSGGNDGRLDFTINFVQRLLATLPDAITLQSNERQRHKLLRLNEQQLHAALCQDCQVSF